MKETKTLEVRIPAGNDDGMRIRSSGNGELSSLGREAFARRDAWGNILL
ncbi:Chaperone protein DnaJ [Caballeronia sordidicola]|uniref:Chaperone protein DnaJ n=1 Tax=Caballeronia sordidicola TaxID=196367 RepID=A0A226X5C2_CABSO|nr:Chaperone protein DnaJ [Caballeronia sordidicola]